MGTTLQPDQQSAHTGLDRRTYLVKEHVGVLKLHEAYDVLDPESGEVIATAVEDASAMKKMLKLVLDKRMLPFTVHLRDAADRILLTIRRGVAFLRSRIEVLDARGDLIGTFQQKLLSIGGKFEISNPKGDVIARLKGNLIGWNFKFTDKNDKELGSVTKKWAGMGKELFTSADNYVVTMNDSVDAVATGPVLLAAALCIDMVLKEAK